MKTKVKCTLILEGKHNRISVDDVRSFVQNLYPDEDSLEHYAESKEDLYVNHTLMSNSEKGWEEAMALNKAIIDKVCTTNTYHEQIRLFGSWLTWCAKNMSTDTFVRQGLRDYCYFICRHFKFHPGSIWSEYYVSEMEND